MWHARQTQHFLTYNQHLWVTGKKIAHQTFFLHLHRLFLTFLCMCVGVSMSSCVQPSRPEEDTEYPALSFFALVPWLNVGFMVLQWGWVGNPDTLGFVHGYQILGHPVLLATKHLPVPLVPPPTSQNLLLSAPSHHQLTNSSFNTPHVVEYL